MTPWEEALRELIAAVDAEANEMPPRVRRGVKIPASPGWAPSIKRVGLAWTNARALCRGD